MWASRAAAPPTSSSRRAPAVPAIALLLLMQLNERVHATGVLLGLLPVRGK